MRKKKDGKQLSSYIDRSIYEQFDMICKIQNRTKTSVLEEALLQAIKPFCAKGIDGCGQPVVAPRKGIYKMRCPGKTVKYKSLPCTILDETIVMGVRSNTIWFENSILVVPAENVECIELSKKKI